MLLLGAVMFSGCSLDNTQKQDSNEILNEQQETQQGTSDAILIGTSEDKKVKLYENTNGVKLDINGNQKEFSWNYPGDTGTAPQVFYTDVTGDGEEEAIIIIQTGRGTGLSHYEIHVVNADDLSEIQVQGYEEIVANYLETHVAKKDDDTLAISVKVKGKDYNFNYGFDPAPDQKQANLGFGGVYTYYLENGKIKLDLGAAVYGTTAYVCDFRISYKFDHTKNEFVADQIEVKPVEI